MPDVLPGNVVIVISGPETDAPGMNADIDCSLATAYMYLAAQSLELAAHLYTGPVSGINENFKEKLEIPEGYRAIIAMKMGNIDDSVDGVSAASARKDLKEFVTYK
jgi:nitroreductase